MPRPVPGSGTNAKRKLAQAEPTQVNGHLHPQQPPAKLRRRSPVRVRDRPTPPTLEPEPQSYNEQFWDKIDKRFQSAAELISAYRRPLPQETGDGTYVPKDEPDFGWKALLSISPTDIDAIASTIEQLKGQSWDDREYQLEHLIQTAVELGQDTKIGKHVKEALLHKLWLDLQHPPQSLLGTTDYTKFQDAAHKQNNQYRSADGSCNNILQPMLGAAGTPYARSVKPVTAQKGSMPDPGLLFDTLMVRRTNQEHENKISSMLFYYASIIIHDIFRTDHKNFSVSNTSSYLDLAPLYGSNTNEQAAMRTHRDGKIWPDTFSEKRLSGFPPGVSVILIMFNRFHNHVVESLAQINENGRFNKPRDLNGTRNALAWDQRDEHLFQTARLITVGLYVNVILYDYIRTILNLNRTDSNWVFDPRMESKWTPNAVGNQVSAEFNLVYRWHSTLSKRDVEWTEKKYKELVGDDASAPMDLWAFIAKLRNFESSIPTDPRKRKLDDLERNEDGRFNDDELVKILKESIEDCANSFGAHRVPEVLRNVEILGIMQARSWNLATLNEFRNYFGLEKYSTFEQINPDKEVADQLRHLYDHPDNVELYPGLVVEQSKRSFLPGSGLMAGFSTTRGILSDATALVRGDRFLTTDYHAKNLTAWGITEASVDPAINNGHVAYKLFLNAFPRHFQYNSIYAHYPFTIPSENRTIMTLLNKNELYSWDPPEATPLPSELRSYKACVAALNDKSTFNVTWGKPMQFLMGPEVSNFMLAGDQSKNEKSRKLMKQSMYIDNWDRDIRAFYRDTCADLLKHSSYSIVPGTKQIDVIRDFSNVAHVRFCAAMFKLPLKSRTRDGIFTENELYLALVAVFILVFFDLDKEHSFIIHRLAKTAAEKLGQCVEKQVEMVKNNNPFANLMKFFMDFATRAHTPRHRSNGTSTSSENPDPEPLISEGEKTMLEDYGWHLISRLSKSTPGLSTKKLVWGHIMGTLGGMVPNQSQGFSEMLEYFLNGDGQRYWPDIVKAASQPVDDKAAHQKLEMYVMEGTRIACASGLFRKVNSERLAAMASTDPNITMKPDGTYAITIDDAPHGVKTINGDTEVFVNLWQACHDPEVFEDPEECKERDISLYPQFGYGPHKCIGFDMIRVAFVEMLRAIAGLPGFKAVDGEQGKVKKIPTGVDGVEGFPGYNKYMTEEWNSFFPFPVTMKVSWDDTERREEVEGGVIDIGLHKDEMVTF